MFLDTVFPPQKSSLPSLFTLVSQKLLVSLFHSWLLLCSLCPRCSNWNGRRTDRPSRPCLRHAQAVRLNHCSISLPSGLDRLRSEFNYDRNNEAALAKELMLQVRKVIGPFAAPKKIYIVSDLPKTRSGKVMRFS